MEVIYFMASTGTKTSQEKGTSEQTGTGTSTGSTQDSNTQKGTTQTGNQQGGETPVTSGRTGQSQSAQGQQPSKEGSSSGGAVSRSSAGGKGVSRQGGFGPTYFPSTAEFFSNPFGVMRRMHEEMDRAFAEAFSGGAHASSGQEGGWSPAIDVSERQGNLVVHADLPGIKPEDVQVEVDNDMLILSGKREHSQQSEQKGFHRRERMYGSFYRAIPLPEGTNTENARAQFNHGVLEVTIPLPQRQAQSRRIPIGSGGQQS
jgi:HSP20 family protein